MIFIDALLNLKYTKVFCILFASFLLLPSFVPIRIARSQASRKSSQNYVDISEIQQRTQITPYEYAKLMSAVYYDDCGTGLLPDIDKVQLPSPKIPDGWAVVPVSLDDLTGTGFFACTYGKYNNGELVKAVVAFRGTDELKEWFNADFAIVRGVVPDEWTLSGRKYVNLLRTKYPTYLDKLYFTGHSLGGALATYASAEFDRQAVIFDAPGTRSAYQYLVSQVPGNEIKAENSDDKIYSIMSAPDIVNKVDNPVGKLFRIYPDFDRLDPDHNKVFLDDSQQHNFKHILAQFNPKTGIPYVYSNLGGVQDAFAQRLDSLYFEVNYNPYFAWNKLVIPTYSANQKAECLGANPSSLGSIAKPCLDIRSGHGTFNRDGNSPNSGLNIIGDDTGNTFFGDTTGSDVVEGGKGIDIYFSFGGSDMITDDGGVDIYHIMADTKIKGIRKIADKDGAGYIMWNDASENLSGSTITKLDEQTYNLQTFIGNNYKLSYNGDLLISDPYDPDIGVLLVNFVNGDFGLLLPDIEDDTERCSDEEKVTDAGDYLGTCGNDGLLFYPRSYAETPVGLANDATIKTFSGDDYVEGSTGDNKIYAGSGDDYIEADPATILPGMDGNDGGNDFVDLGSGGDGSDHPQDSAYLGNGDDVGFTGEQGGTIFDGYLCGYEDFCDLDESAPLFYETHGNDLLYGSSGPDMLIGSAGINYLYGGASSDYLRAEPSNPAYNSMNYMFGEDGDDVYFVSNNNASITDSKGSNIYLINPHTLEQARTIIIDGFDTNPNSKIYISLNWYVSRSQIEIKDYPGISYQYNTETGQLVASYSRTRNVQNTTPSSGYFSIVINHFSNGILGIPNQPGAPDSPPDTLLPPSPNSGNGSVGKTYLPLMVN